MHFNPMLITVVKSVVGKTFAIKICIEKFIQALENVEVEAGCYSLTVVVGAVE